MHGDARIVHQTGEVLQPARREVIEDRNTVAMMNEEFRQMRADEAGSAGNECPETVVTHIHGRFSLPVNQSCGAPLRLLYRRLVAPEGNGGAKARCRIKAALFAISGEMRGRRACSGLNAGWPAG
jgi:hypothetical protein